MFLLARSAVCIALVVAALPNRPPQRSDTVAFDTIASGASGIAEAAVDRFCRHAVARCARSLTQMVAVVEVPATSSSATGL